MLESSKTIVLVGLMGAGKSRVGAELAKLLKIPFIDADREIEKAAGCSVADIFEMYGEKAFRDGERKVMIRLLSEGEKVLAAGGGAFIQSTIRKEIKRKATSVWIKAELDTLVERTSRTSHRPLLQEGDPAEKLQQLIEARYPVYAEADITVVSDNQTPFEMAEKIHRELDRFWRQKED